MVTYQNKVSHNCKAKGNKGKIMETNDGKYFDKIIGTPCSSVH